MTLEFKSQYLQAIRRRYFNSTKKGKSQILNELCNVTGYSRKHAIRILAEGHMTGKKNSGRTIAYSKNARFHLKKLWHVMGRICSKKMVAALPIWLEFYQRPNFTVDVKQEILSMSSSTIDRYLKEYKKQFARRRRTGTRRSKKYQNVIPVKSFEHFADRPGYLQADTVAHCGNSLSGKFIWTMTITDEHTGWTENRTMFGKGGFNSVDAVISAFAKIPFTPVSFHSDNGTEFLNKPLHSFLVERNNIKFTRSRPYRKNDAAHVEQKNFTHVRELFGYERLDFDDLIFDMDTIYRSYFNVLQNFFVPQQKLISKKRVGSKYIKEYDTPLTPYQRVMLSPFVSKRVKSDLKSKYETLNPIELKERLDIKMKEFRNRVKRLKEEQRSDYQLYEDSEAS